MVRVRSILCSIPVPPTPSSIENSQKNCIYLSSEREPLLPFKMRQSYLSSTQVPSHWQVPTCTGWISSLSPISRFVLLTCACEELSEKISCDTSTFSSTTRIVSSASSLGQGRSVRLWLESG